MAGKVAGPEKARTHPATPTPTPTEEEPRQNHLPIGPPLPVSARFRPREPGTPGPERLCLEFRLGLGVCVRCFGFGRVQDLCFGSVQGSEFWMFLCSVQHPRTKP